MGTPFYPTVPVAQPEAEPWPVDAHTIRADEMFARRLDTEFSAGVRDLLHNPETGLSNLKGEAALEAIAGALPALVQLKERTLAQAIGPRQRGLLEPMIDTRLDWAAGTIGQLAQRATIEVDDASVADRLAGLNRDAATAWRDPAYLRKLGRSAVNELRYQGERRGWAPAETDTRVRAGLSDLYAGAVESAIGQDDLDGAAALYEHARPVIDPGRQAILDHRFERAREVALYRAIDRKLADLPLDPAGPPGLEVFQRQAGDLVPDNASDTIRAGIAQVAGEAHRYAERQWHKQQADAGLAALDWLNRNPATSLFRLPWEVRDWLAPDQWDALIRAAIAGRVETDPDLHDRLDRQAVYEPESFAGLDLDRVRLDLADRDFARLAAIQQAQGEGRTDPAQARWGHTLAGLDRALQAKGIDLESPAARDARTRARDRLVSFETIEGRSPRRADLDGIVRSTADGVAPERAVSEPGESVRADGPSVRPDTSSVDEPEPASVRPGSAHPTRQGAVLTEDGESPPFSGDPNIVRVGGGGNASRRAGGGRPPTPIEEMRAANFQSTLNALRELEPNNRELSYIAPRGWVPGDRDVARVQEELARARQRAAIPGAPTESMPGRDHNNPPGLVDSARPSARPPTGNDLSSGQVPGTAPGQPPSTAIRGSQGTPPVPDGAGPASAAEQAAAEKRMAAYNTYREHLRELDPDNALLKVEPKLGIPPDEVAVESIEKEVGAIVQGKLGRFVFRNYDKYPNDKTLNGERGKGDDVRILRGDKAKAEADFADLSKGAAPHTALSGQHAESQTILKLPGRDMYVGFRINKEGLPTIDINSPHTGSIRFHYK